MILFTLIIESSSKALISDKLKELDFIDSFIFTGTECHNRQCEGDKKFNAHDLVVGHVPKLKLEVMIDHHYQAEFIEFLKSQPFLKNKTSYFILQLTEFSHL